MLDRRSFITRSLGVATGIAWFSEPAELDTESTSASPNVIGPMEGYTPQVGTLLSMMNWMRSVVLQSVQGMQTRDLDYLIDSKANTIGAMLLHLAALEVFYQVNTFDKRKAFNTLEKRKWDAALNLGESGRKTIKGYDLTYYLSVLQEVREKTKAEFRNRDDAWLKIIDYGFWDQPTNNYCKWFHVCEHESNHNGQIRWVKSRLPGANSDTDK